MPGLLFCAAICLLVRGLWAGEPAAATLPAVPGHHKLRFEAKAGEGPLPLPYLLYLPLEYSPAAAPYPVVIFLHGAGECGDNLDAIWAHGPAPALDRIPKFKERYPFVGLYPQCVPGRRWDSPGQVEAVLQLLDFLVPKLRIDPDRLYATGLSMGGKGTWLLAHAAPQRFAAIAPISAVEVEPEKAAERFKSLAVWIICGGSDGGFTEGSKKMAEILKGSPSEVKLTMVPNRGHDVWNSYYPDPQFYEWFLTHRRPAPPKPPPPEKTVVKPPPEPVPDGRLVHRTALTDRLAKTVGARKERLSIKVFGTPHKVTVTGGDTTSLRVEWSGNAIPLRWGDVADDDLAQLGVCYGAEDEAMLYHAACLARLAGSGSLSVDAVSRLRKLKTAQAKERLSELEGKLR